MWLGQVRRCLLVIPGEAARGILEQLRGMSEGLVLLFWERSIEDILKLQSIAVACLVDPLIPGAGNLTIHVPNEIPYDTGQFAGSVNPNRI